MDISKFNLCNYRKIFGIPKSGIHKYRIFNLAVVDILLTLLLAFIISYYFKIQIYKSIFFCFLFGILMHRIFCVRTTIDKWLF